MTNTSHNCPHCGKRLARSDSAFCTNCGTPLLSEALATVHGGSLGKIIIQIPGEESREEFLSKTITTLGRRRNNMIQVLSPIVSGEHARIELTRQGHTITDLNSTNGTYVSGQKLQPGKSYLLSSGDIVRFSDGLDNSASLTYVAPTLFTDVEAVEISGLFELTTTISYIGRNPDAAITLDHPAISWNHAKVIKRDENRYTIQDLSSNNGTFLNGTQLRHERSLERGDVIQIGPFNLVYRAGGIFAPFSAERNFRLEAVDLEKTFYAANLFGTTNLFGQKKKDKAVTVLHNLDLVVNPREFVALVGGSGTGKSTLLKALNGLSPATSGTVLVNGDNLYKNFNLYRNMMGYVPQDDIIHQGLEVHQALVYAAQLRLPDAAPPEIEERIQDVLAKVGLTAQADTLVRNLSGGQRKRVSIAAELLAEPWIFFLDEPTSGLDPGLEKLMMDTLRQLADEGRTIVLVTHATANITNNCDQVAFMARGGELAYFGPPAQATEFFNVNNFPDIYTRLSQTYTADKDPTVPATIKAEYDETTQEEPSSSAILAGPLWAARYRKTAGYQTYITNRQTGEVARPITETSAAADVSVAQQFNQFGVLSRRYLALLRHDKLSLWVLLAVMPIIAFLLLLISDGAALVGNTMDEIAAILDTDGVYTIVNQAQTLLFMLALSANLLGIFAASFEIIKEDAIYRRERMINLRIFPYFASKFVVLGLFMLLQCLLLLIVLAVGVDFPGGGAILWSPLEFYFTLVFTALASVALGLFISALATSRNTVVYLVLIVLFVQIVFSGAIFELSPLTQPLSYLTISRWSLEALGASTDMDGLNNLGQVRVEREVDLGRGIQKVVEDFPTTISFTVNYSHNALGLLSRWIFLWVQIILWSSLAIWLIKRKDEI